MNGELRSPNSAFLLTAQAGIARVVSDYILGGYGLASFLKNRTFFMSVLLIAAALAAVAFLLLHRPAGTVRLISETNPPYTWEDFRESRLARKSHMTAVALAIGDQWGHRIRALVKAGELRPEEFEKIDFSLPGDPTYGDNPDLEFFNPAGRFKAPLPPQDWIDQLTTVKGTRPIFNIRRFISCEDDIDLQGHTVEVLTAIIPNMHASYCLPTFRPAGSHEGIGCYDNNALVKGLVIAPDNRTVVEDDEHFIHCTRSADSGNTYFFSDLITRHRRTEKDPWLTY